MTVRKATEEVRVMFDVNTMEALKVAAALRGEPVAAVVRRAVERSLATANSDAQSQVLAEAVRAVVRSELRHTRRLAFLAAFESATARRAADDLLGAILVHAAHRSHDQAAALLDVERAKWLRYAAQRTRDPEPADPLDNAPAEALPKAGDEVDIEDADTATMVAGE